MARRAPCFIACTVPPTQSRHSLEGGRDMQVEPQTSFHCPDLASHATPRVVRTHFKSRINSCGHSTMPCGNSLFIDGMLTSRAQYLRLPSKNPLAQHCGIAITGSHFPPTEKNTSDASLVPLNACPHLHVDTCFNIHLC